MISLTATHEIITQCYEEYGHSADAINERSEHRYAFTKMVNFSLFREGGCGWTVDEVCRAVINLRKKGVLRGVSAKEKVLFIPSVYDKNIFSLSKAYRRITGAGVERIIGENEHRSKFTELFNKETDAGWEEDRVMVRIVQLRKCGKLRPGSLTS